MTTRVATSLVIAVVAAGCVGKPQESEQEVLRLDPTARQFGYTTARTTPATRPTLIDLPPAPTRQEVLQRAFLANGDLEASFHEWAMAIERIDQAGTWPTSDVELGFEYMFSGERMKSFNRTTVSAGLMDPSALPNKSYENAKVAWHEAQAAGERFRAAKFELQTKVLQAWADYALQAERVRIQEQNLGLLKLVSETAASRVRAGSPQQEQVRADVEQKIAQSELDTARAELRQQRAALNGLLRREADTPLEAPKTMPAPRPLQATDEQLLTAGVLNNADLAALGRDAEARAAAITRAQLEYQPGINPMAAFTGSISQTLGAAISLPTQWPKIRGMVAEARADLRRVNASAAQAGADRASRFASTLVALRDAERRSHVFEGEVIPLAQQAVDLARRSYSAGASTYLDLIDAQRTLLEVRLTTAEAKTARERSLAELEALAGMDVETLAPTQTTTQP
jgi:outer membrane protein TolC